MTLRPAYSQHFCVWKTFWSKSELSRLSCWRASKHLHVLVESFECLRSNIYLHLVLLLQDVLHMSKYNNWSMWRLYDYMSAIYIKSFECFHSNIYLHPVLLLQGVLHMSKYNNWSMWRLYICRPFLLLLLLHKCNKNETLFNCFDYVTANWFLVFLSHCRLKAVQGTRVSVMTTRYLLAET